MHIARVRSGLLGVAALLGACAGNSLAQPPVGPDPIGELIEAPPIDAPAAKPALPKGVARAPRRKTLTRYIGGLERASCPASVARVAPATIGLGVKPLPLQALNPVRKTVGQLTYVAGFHLTSDDARFGGLSGIEVLGDGSLLTVTDKGALVWIALGKDGVTPMGAQIAAMQDAKGRSFPGKSDADAEGLAVLGEMALVSFEGKHRVLAYNIGRCSAAARGAPVGWSLTPAFAKAKMSVDGNRGAEALAITPEGYLFIGVETKAGKASALSARPLEAAPDFQLAIGENAPELVGLDLIPAGANDADVRAFELHRSLSPLAGDAIMIIETYLERDFDQSNLPARILNEADERSRVTFRIKSTRTLAEMNLLLTIDNFEGIAAQQLPDGRVRLFIVSDDNFSANQRTLLMVFDIAKRG